MAGKKLKKASIRNQDKIRTLKKLKIIIRKNQDERRIQWVNKK